MARGFASDKSTEMSAKSATLNKPQPISIEDLQTGFSTYFNDGPDPRVERTKQHLLKDILVIALLAVIAGAEGWEDMENYGISKLSWLKQFLELPNGIPSDDTFCRGFEKLDPKILEQKLAQLIRQLVGSVLQ